MLKFSKFLLNTALIGLCACQDYEVISCNSNANNVSKETADAWTKSVREGMIYTNMFFNMILGT